MYAEGTKTVLRSGPTPLYNLQLLPEAAIAGDRTSAKSLREGTAQSSTGIQILFGRLCGDAESRASADQRAEKRHAVDSAANA